MIVLDPGIEIFDDIDAIGREAWEGLVAGRRLEFGYDYLAFARAVQPDRQRYVCAYDSYGTILGALYGRIAAPGVNFFSAPSLLFSSPQILRTRADDLDAEVRATLSGLELDAGADPLQSVRAWMETELYPCLVISSMTATEALLQPGLGGKARGVIRRLVEAVAGDKSGGDWRSVAFFYLTPDQLELEEELQQRGAPGALWCADNEIAGLDRGADFERYVERLGRSPRSMVRRERRAFQGSLLRIEEIDLAAERDRVAELEAATARKNGVESNVDEFARANDALCSHLRGRLRAVGCFRGDRLVASATGLDRGDAGYQVLGFGADYERSRGLPVYAHLVFYEPVEYVVAQGRRRLLLGIEGYEAKALRGARREGRRVRWLVPARDGRRRLHRWLSIVGRANRRYFSELRRTLPLPAGSAEQR